MAKLIEMPFGMLSGVGPKKHVFDGSRSPMCKGNFEGGKEQPIIKCRDLLPIHIVILASMIEPSMCSSNVAFLSHYLI